MNDFKHNLKVKHNLRSRIRLSFQANQKYTWSLGECRTAVKQRQSNTQDFRVLSMSCLSDLMYVPLESTVKCLPPQLTVASSGHQAGTEASSVTVVSSEDLSVNTSLAWAVRTKLRPKVPTPARCFPADLPDSVCNSPPSSRSWTGADKRTGIRRFRITPVWWVLAVSSWPM